MQVQAIETSRAEIDLEALLSGDAHEFEKLVRQESPRLFRVILRIVRDENEAESVMQEAYLQAYKRLGTFRRESKFTTWLYAIAINLAKAALRKSLRYTSLQGEDIDRLQPTFVDGHYIDSFETWRPDKVTELEDRKRIVQEAIDRLPPDYRAIVILRDIEELSTAEAAAMLNITEGAARVRLHRARQALRTILDGYFR
jgi:RNA polymerase sigma-70 factor (ECF subfamily)